MLEPEGHYYSDADHENSVDETCGAEGTQQVVITSPPTSNSDIFTAVLFESASVGHIDDVEKGVKKWDGPRTTALPGCGIIDIKTAKARLAASAEGVALRRHSTMVGLFVGCLLQFGSLGANYVWTVFQQQQIVSEHESAPVPKLGEQVVLYSVIWSFGTSVLGVLVLLVFRTLIMLVRQEQQSQEQYQRQRQGIVFDKESMWHEREEEESYESWFASITEVNFAIGALVGVCLAWGSTDFVVGYNLHIFHSMITLFVALIWGRILSCYYSHLVVLHKLNDVRVADGDGSSDEDTIGSASSYPCGTGERIESVIEHVIVPVPIVELEDHNSIGCDSNLTEPFLSPSSTDEALGVSGFDVKATQRFNLFRLFGLFLGSLVGVFVHIGSLGANYIIVQLFRNYSAASPFEASQDRHQVMLFCGLWSLITSVVGVLILIVVSRLLVRLWSLPSFRYPAQWPVLALGGNRDLVPVDEEALEQKQEKWMVNLESMFAIGSMIGFNLAWLGTELVLGVPAHLTPWRCVFEQLFPLFGVLLWCKFVILNRKDKTRHGN